jgi:aminoglycoside 2'-N-acetyltransferase I
MSIEIDVLNGDASWSLAEPLFKAVWPSHVIAKLPWGRFAFAYPEWRVLVRADPEGVVSHVGIQRAR